MKTLVVLRHADAAARPAGTDDRDRPLTARGQGQAAAAARLLKQLLPDGPGVALCSAAARARLTAAPAAALFPATTLRMEPDLYGADAASWLEWIRDLDDSVASVLLVGHNPGLESLVLALCGELVPLAPATMAVLESAATSWKDIRPGAARLLRVRRPDAGTA